MMKWLKRILFAGFCVALLGGAVYAGGFLLPGEARLESTASMDAETQHVFKVFNDAELLKGWWTVAARRTLSDFTAEQTGGPEAGVGVELSFRAGGRSMGKNTITESVPDERVVYDVDYGKFSLVRTVSLDPVGPTTSVTWTETATLDQPLLRYMALLSESRLEQEIEVALQSVKDVAEPLATEARAEIAAEAEAAKAAAAALREVDAARKRAENDKSFDEWEYSGEEAPTPIDVTKLPPPERTVKTSR